MTNAISFQGCLLLRLLLVPKAIEPFRFRAFVSHMSILEISYSGKPRILIFLQHTLPEIYTQNESMIANIHFRVAQPCGSYTFRNKQSIYASCLYPEALS